MSFFGFEQNDLEQERRRFKDDRLDSTSDIPVYTWGVEEGYDGLGDGLQERGDDLNDETFGNLGEVGEWDRSFKCDSYSISCLIIRQGLQFLPTQFT